MVPLKALMPLGLTMGHVIHDVEFRKQNAPHSQKRHVCLSHEKSGAPEAAPLDLNRCAWMNLEVHLQNKRSLVFGVVLVLAVVLQVNGSAAAQAARYADRERRILCSGFLRASGEVML